jgi:hypothetical protein
MEELEIGHAGQTLVSDRRIADLERNRILEPFFEDAVPLEVN